MTVNSTNREIFVLTGSGFDKNLEDFYPRRIVLALWRIFSHRLNKQDASFNFANSKKKVECPSSSSCAQKSFCTCNSHYNCCGGGTSDDSSRNSIYDKKAHSESGFNEHPMLRAKGVYVENVITYCSNSFSATAGGEGHHGTCLTFSASSPAASTERVMHRNVSVTHCQSSSTTNESHNRNPSRVRSKTSTMGLRGFFVLFYLLILVGSSFGCGPGRGAGRRRAPRKLTPLVYKQHVPNVPENTLSASGLNEGKITRDHPRFKALVPNYNTDIIFRDDEGSGADRLMTQRCKEKLNTLAISVMNQWPGVKLRVIEGWDEENLHAQHSLHYEGRAVDITTSDKDRSKYGMLARLAVEAGFDWVYYESRAHIHCSVKSDSSQAARTGGCFSGNSTVETRWGQQKISEIQPGDEILTVDKDGAAVYSEVLLFLDRNSSETREFYVLNLESGRSLTLTPSHLLYALQPDNLSVEQLRRLQNSTMTAKYFLELAEITFARNIEEGQWLLVHEDGNWSSSAYETNSNDIINRDYSVKSSYHYSVGRIVSMEVRVVTGVYAPLTSTGNLIVDGVLASCYAVIDDQNLAHWAFAPVRLAHNVYLSVSHLWKRFTHFITFSHRSDSGANSSSQSSNLIHVHDNEIVEGDVRRTHSQPQSHLLRRSDDSSSQNYISRQQGIHWYASFLYSATKYILPSHLLYD